MLKKELRKKKLLKLKLNIIIRKKKLKKILKNIMKEYSAFLHSNLFKKMKKLCLKAFAQKYNNNQKHQLKKINFSFLANSDSDIILNICLTSFHSRLFFSQ